MRESGFVKRRINGYGLTNHASRTTHLLLYHLQNDETLITIAKVNTMDLNQLVGQHLIIGVPGTRVTDAIVRQFRQTHAGGLILFRPNIESPPQLTAFIRELEEALQRRLLVMIDHEGGRVIHMTCGVTVFPSALAIGATDDPTHAEQQGRIEALELRRLGIDVNLAPVLDVLTPAYSPNIGIRSYGTDPQLVARMSVARIRAMQAAGLSACAKHFPGKGHATVDAHLSLPVVHSTWQEMEHTHLVPFRRAIESGVDLVMTSHPHYPRLDPAPGAIATFSRRIVTDYLRGELGYDGIVTSDDLEMSAIKELCGVGEAAVRAVAAGHDVVLACHDLRAQLEAAAALRDAYHRGTLKTQDLERTIMRLERLQAKRPERFAPSDGNPTPEPEGTRVAEEICYRAARVLRGRPWLPFPSSWLRGRRIVAIMPRLSHLGDRIMIEPALMDEMAFVRNLLAAYGVSAMTSIVSIEPTDAEIASATAMAQLADLIILYLFDAHLYPSNQQLLEQTLALADGSERRVAVVLLRDPYDTEWVRDPAACVTGYGFRACELRAATRLLFE